MVRPGRLVTVSSAGGVPIGVADDLPLADAPRPGPWRAVITAPESEDGLSEVFVALAALALLVDADPGDEQSVRERALTLVLSGRADLVGVPG